ncbi:hypothetical protein H351_30075 (plasmid) [Rhodococcus erythropolis R138]|uniref:DUF3320 domain-containing protein n=1 Tax=Rhodococcus erythropolis TaxID=1833 RepID=UPI0007394B8E|nr:DUF3320 domain-containing protein [Rhodococcus erythropolis]ALU73335.1 hypothetical protein H351_30075 [Rhodococcus erythropolis R138]
MDNRAAIQKGLDHLASRLNPYFAAALTDELGGLPWTAVLTELDRAKGYTPRQHSSGDLQAQLRLLTERLGKLGFPFDDPTRTVSVLGGELRIVRNRWAHNDDFSSLDVWRALDFVVRLLSHLGDHEGTTTAEILRTDALSRVVAESGLTETTVSPTETEDGGEHVEPDKAVLERDGHIETPTIGEQRLEFEQWIVVPAGDIAVLDDLPKKIAKEAVRAVAAEIVEYEGPIQLDRLASLTAQSFGVSRLYDARSRKLIYQIKMLDCEVDSEKFVWPARIDRATWTEFRPNSSSISRPFDEISPVEIANAARFILRGGPMEIDQLETSVLRTFGRRRRSPMIKNHLQKSLKYAQSVGFLRVDRDRYIGTTNE